MWVIRISAMLKRTLEKLLTGRGLRHLTARPKLVLCIPIVALSYFMLPATWNETTRLLIAWNIGTWPYIVLTVRAMARANEASIRRQALMGDQSRFVVLTFCMAAALASLAATIAQLGSVKEAQGLLRMEHLILAFGTIISAFVFIHLVFTQHYAHEFFILRASGRAGSGTACTPMSVSRWMAPRPSLTRIA